MDTKKIIFLLVTILAIVTFVSCDSLQGPEGPAGEDGVDGDDGSYPTIDVSGISVYPKTLELEKPGSVSNELEATIIPSNATNQLIHWESSDDGVVEVDSNGVVTSHAYGSVDVTATSDDGGFYDIVEVIVGFYSSVLYYADNISLNATHDRYLEGLESLHEEGLVELTETDSSSEVELAIDEQTYDTIVFFQQDFSINSPTAESLIDWIQSGGNLIFFSYTTSGADDLLDELEVSFTGYSNQEEITFLTQTSTKGLEDNMELFTDPWITHSVGLTAQGSAYSICSFENGDSCGVLGNEGRTLTLGFASDTLPDDTERQIAFNTLNTILD